MSIAKHTPGPWKVQDMSHMLPDEPYWIGSEHPEFGFCSFASVRPGCTEASELGDMAANAGLIAAAPELLAVVQEAVRINQATLILADGMDSTGKLFTEAQRADARAFLAKRSAVWLGTAFEAIAKATGST